MWSFQTGAQNPNQGNFGGGGEMEKAMLLLGIIMNQHASMLENALNRSATAILDRVNALVDIST